MRMKGLEVSCFVDQVVWWAELVMENIIEYRYR